MGFIILFGKSTFLRNALFLSSTLLTVTVLTACTKVQPAEVSKSSVASVSISSSKYHKIGNILPITFTLTNNSNRALSFLKWGTPFESNITRDQFSISQNGKELSYTGIMVKRAKPTEQDYIQIEPKQSLKATIDISKSYTFNTLGIYNVTYKESFLDIKKTEGLNLVKASNSVLISLAE